MSKPHQISSHVGYSAEECSDIFVHLVSYTEYIQKQNIMQNWQARGVITQSCQTLKSIFIHAGSIGVGICPFPAFKNETSNWKWKLRKGSERLKTRYCFWRVTALREMSASFLSISALSWSSLLWAMLIWSFPSSEGSQFFTLTFFSFHLTNFSKQATRCDTKEVMFEPMWVCLVGWLVG